MTKIRANDPIMDLLTDMRMFHGVKYISWLHIHVAGFIPIHGYSTFTDGWVQHMGMFDE